MILTHQLVGTFTLLKPTIYPDPHDLVQQEVRPLTTGSQLQAHQNGRWAPMEHGMY